MSSTTIVAAKLFPPKSLQRYHPRHAVFQKLKETATHSPVIAFHGPGGYGKTTTAWQWLASQKIDYAWLSLDEQDTDPQRFWSHMLAAISQVIQNTDWQTWSQSNALCRGVAVEGSPFWLTQEIGFAPALLDAGTEFLDSLPAPAGTSAKPAASLLPAISTADGNTVQGLVFDCAGEQLAAQLHRGGANSDTGVLIVVGGPQYRVGSHRQFQQLAAHLGAAGVPVLRFDYRGMGDSSGELRGFTAIGQDIRSAVDAFTAACPPLERVVLWGLCDAATASVFYAHEDSRVRAMVLANPWVYSEQGEARAYLKHYYRDRLLSRELWRKVLRGDFDWRGSIASLAGFVRNALGAGTGPAAIRDGEPGETAAVVDADADLVASFTRGLLQFGGDTLFIISGNDLTAAEFMDAARAHESLRQGLTGSRTSTLELPGADHTFSRRAASEEVESATLSFVQGLSR